MMKPKSLAQPDKLFFGQFKDDTGKWLGNVYLYIFKNVYSIEKGSIF
jgi:hypothetical protein